MPIEPDDLRRFLTSVHPYDALDTDALDVLVPQFLTRSYKPGEEVYAVGSQLEGLYLVHTGQVEIRDENGVAVSLLGPRNSFGERGLMREGLAATTASALDETVLLMLPAYAFRELVAEHAAARRFFDRSRAARPRKSDLAHSRVETLMARAPLTVPPETPAQQAALMMREEGVSSLCITRDRDLIGIVTIRDISAKVVAGGMDTNIPVSEIMSHEPVTLPPSAIGSDVLHTMVERGIGHVPITDAGRLVGIVTQTDLTRFQAVSSAELVAAIARARSPAQMAETTARIPQLLAQLVAGGNRHEVTTRLITDIADTVTRRLLALAEEDLGTAPVPWLWLACGSQGRQEQTGVSDQDNCMILDDSATERDLEYFREMAKFVCDGLDNAGYFYCPGDMMATNPRWLQTQSVWRKYFRGWIEKPDPEAQMLASVMFDLRPIGGTKSLFEDLQNETLEAASKNSIFTAHMISNSLKHTPPLGLLRGFATIRSGEHKNTVDLKHNGVVPVVDLARVYALQARLPEAGTRARIEGAIAAGAVSGSGGQDLLDAYDLIAETRLEHQATLVKRGEKPDNYLAPSDLSDFERSHLRDAFVVIKSMQSAIGHGRGMLG